MLAKPLMGAIADRFQLKKTLFIIFQVLTAIALLPINFIPAVPRESQAHFSCDNGAAVFDTSRLHNNHSSVDECVLQQIKDLGMIQCKASCPELAGHEWPPGGDPRFIANIMADKIEIFKGILVLRIKEVLLGNKSVAEPACLGVTGKISAACDLTCNSTVITEAMEVSHVQTLGDAAGWYQFWLFLFLAIAAWVSMAVVVSIGDAICFELLGDRPSQYGMQRLWGSVGWGVFSIIAGYMVDQFSEGGVSDYTTVFALMSVMMILDLATSAKLCCSQQRMSASIAKDIYKLLVRPRIVVYLAWCILMGMCTALLWQFLFWHLEDLAKHTSVCTIIIIINYNINNYIT